MGPENESTLVQLCSEKKRKSGGMRKLYITLSRQNQALSYHNQSVNLVSFRNGKNSPNKPHKSENLEQISLTVTHPMENCRPADSSLAPAESTVVFYREGKPLQAVGGSEGAKILKITNVIKEREFPLARSRGSSSSSQVTLTTSYSKIDDDGNNNAKNGEAYYNGKLKSKNVVERKTKCQCWNCEKKKGITSLRNKCLFKTKSQSATLETIAKKIGFLPSRSSKGESTGQGGKKLKLTKTLSSYTISNSSLQDLDESEFTSSELADMMGQMKHREEVQV